MSSTNQKPGCIKGCLTLYLGLCLFSLMTYGPIYLFFFDSSKDKALNASYITVMRVLNGTNTKSQDKTYKEVAELVKKETGIDLTESIEDALEHSEKIEDIECTENSLDKISLISIHFVHKERGPGTIRAYVKPPSFFEVKRAELVAFDTDVQFRNGKKVSIDLFLADIYGFDEKAFNKMLPAVFEKVMIEKML